MQEIYRRMELAAVEVLAATQLTCLFGFMAWLGANSLAWGIGLLGLGLLADLFRWLFRFDWPTRRFVRKDRDPRKYLAELERLLANEADARRLGRLHSKVVWGGIASWFAVTIPILIVNSVWGDAPFCAAAPVLDVFNHVAVNLVEVIRENTRRLTAAGYDCRSVFIAFYYSVWWYAIVAGSIFYVVAVADFSAAIVPVNAIRKRRVPNLETLLEHDAKLWRGLFFSALQIFFLSGFTYILMASMKSGGTRSWNIHEINFKLYTMSIASIGIFIAISLSNSIYAACRAVYTMRGVGHPKLANPRENCDDIRN